MLSSDERKAIGTAFADIRRKAGLTQAELSEASGVTQATISRVEAGEHCALGTLQALARSLDVKVSYVLRRAQQ